MRSGMEMRLAEFLKQRRGAATSAQFARKLGITPSTLFRLEHPEQSITAHEPFPRHCLYGTSDARAVSRGPTTMDDHERPAGKGHLSPVVLK